jgi:hypothetical protein
MNSLISATTNELDELLQYLTPQELAEMDTLLAQEPVSLVVPDSRIVRLDDLLIRTKDRKLIPFAPNQVQIKYLDQILPEWRDGKITPFQMREILLKARQFGFSTLVAAIFFCDTINTPNTTTVVVANDADSTEKLFRMVQLFYEHLPEEKKPRTKYSNKRELYWQELNSSYYVGTAGDRSFGRGNTINNLHCSEVAFYPDAEELLSGLLEAVPDDGNVVLESTANGVGDLFHKEFELAQQGDSSFTGRFFAWFEHPPYSKAVPPDFTRTEDEQKLVTTYGLNDRQLAWRRSKMNGPGMRLKFKQEYPGNPREAFLVSGAKYFDPEKLQEIELVLTDVAPIKVDAPDTGGLLKKHWDKVEVYTAPVVGRQYVISADTAEGLNDDGDHDFDSADVLDCATWEQVAHLHGQWDTHEYGLLLAELGFWYNTALLGIERNNHGHAVINAALHSGGYPVQKPGEWIGLYHHEDYDERKKAKLRKPGWPTTAKTKYFALDGLASSIETDDLKVRSKGTLGELMTFLKLRGGKAGATPGSHDDRVMSLAIGDALLKTRPRQKPDPEDLKPFRVKLR